MICTRDDDCNDLLHDHSADITRALYHSGSLKFGSFRLKSGNRSHIILIFHGCFHLRKTSVASEIQ